MKSTQKRWFPYVPPDENRVQLKSTRRRRVRRGVMTPVTPCAARCCALSGFQPAAIKTPSPWGEGWGEGVTEQSHKWNRCYALAGLQPALTSKAQFSEEIPAIWPEVKVHRQSWQVYLRNRLCTAIHQKPVRPSHLSPIAHFALTGYCLQNKREISGVV